MSNATLHFHSIAAKNVFLKRNKFQASEILDETPTSITIANNDSAAMYFIGSPFVFQISTK